MNDPHEQALDILQKLNFGQEHDIAEETPEPEREPIRIVSIHHEADKNFLQRLASHLNVMKRQLAASEGVLLNHESYEIWTNYPTDDVQEALPRAKFLLILMGLELLTAIYNDDEFYRALQQTIRNRGAVDSKGTTMSIVLMTTKVQWSRDEFPVSTFYPQSQALASIRDKDEVYVEMVGQIRQWITQR